MIVAYRGACDRRPRRVHFGVDMFPSATPGWERAARRALASDCIAFKRRASTSACHVLGAAVGAAFEQSWKAVTQGCIRGSTHPRNLCQPAILSDVYDMTKTPKCAPKSRVDTGPAPTSRPNVPINQGSCIACGSPAVSDTFVARKVVTSDRSF
ncbi:hypothetical protein DFH07DRAFT_830773 [Mycena maculata]|uniref:Uncharacterized protein n=1 Tax=Mycena maculata TaxID=230809 RepID=A0AAD7IQC6_9AGAR|nr:hypothetical protein DFH07DRAFT_830773 [Mycena maculata]